MPRCGILHVARHGIQRHVPHEIVAVGVRDVVVPLVVLFPQFPRGSSVNDCVRLADETVSKPVVPLLWALETESVPREKPVSGPSGL